MKNASILFAILLLAGCSGMRSSGASGSGAAMSGDAWGSGGSTANYATTADQRLGMSDVRMGSQNALEGPFSGLTWRQ